MENDELRDSWLTGCVDGYLDRCGLGLLGTRWLMMNVHGSTMIVKQLPGAQFFRVANDHRWVRMVARWGVNIIAIANDHLN